MLLSSENRMILVSVVLSQYTRVIKGDRQQTNVRHMMTIAELCNAIACNVRLKITSCEIVRNSNVNGWFHDVDVND